MSPVTSITEGLQQVQPRTGPRHIGQSGAAPGQIALTVISALSSSQIVTMGLFRTIALFYLGSFDSIVRRCMIQREQSKAANKRE